MIAVDAYRRKVEFSRIGPNKPRFGLHLANSDRGTCNVVMDSAMELYFAESCILKCVFGRNCTGYWANLLLEGNESEYSKLFVESPGQTA